MSGNRFGIAQWTPQVGIEFLEEAAKYFANRPDGGEDRAYWSNVNNSEHCTKIAEFLKTLK